MEQKACKNHGKSVYLNKIIKVVIMEETDDKNTLFILKSDA